MHIHCGPWCVWPQALIRLVIMGLLKSLLRKISEQRSVVVGLFCA